MYVVTSQQMQAAEKAADAAGLSYEQMMENAGQAVARVIETEFDLSQARSLILVGPGNNGGDGLVMARYLAQAGAKVTIYPWRRKTEGDRNWDLLDHSGIECLLEEDAARPGLRALLEGVTIIVDALLGTGVSRPIEGDLGDLLNQVKTAVLARRVPRPGNIIEPPYPQFNSERGPVVVAVDLPSGLNSNTGAVDPHTLPADITVTLAAVKRGHVLLPGADVVGRLVVADIGITADYYPNDVTLEMATASKVMSMLPVRRASSHKGTFGTALLVTGSRHYTGAAILSGQAAGRIGAGLVTMAPPEAIYPIVAASLAEATYWPLPHHQGQISPEAVKPLKEALPKADALLVGPGLGHSEATTHFLTGLLSHPETLPPLILDADALNILAEQPEWWRLLPPDSILTPHPGEMARLSGKTTPDVQAERLDLAVQMAAQWEQIVLLKGAYTVIAAPHGRAMVMPFANPAMAKAGAGDVLAGAITGLRAQRLPPFEAAVAGAYLHGLAGELARDSLGVMSVVAGDLIDFLPAATALLV